MVFSGQGRLIDMINVNQLWYITRTSRAKRSTQFPVLKPAAGRCPEKYNSDQHHVNLARAMHAANQDCAVRIPPEQGTNHCACIEEEWPRKFAHACIST